MSRPLRSNTPAGFIPSRLPTPTRRRTPMPGGLPETAGADTRLYSEAVAPRPASPQGEIHISTISSHDLVSPGPEYLIENDHDGPDESKEVSLEVAENSQKESLNEEIVDSGIDTNLHEREIIELATESLTAEEKEKIQRRQDAVDAQKNKAEKAKGKSVDPREWGGVKLDETEMDPETQEALLKNFKAQKLDHDCDHDLKKDKLKKISKTKSDDESKFDQKNKTLEMYRPRIAASAGHAQNLKRAGSRPAAQIAPASSVGLVLGEIAKHGTYPGDDDSGGDSPSDSSDPGNNDYFGYTTDEESSRTKKRNSKKHGKSTANTARVYQSSRFRQRNMMALWI